MAMYCPIALDLNLLAYQDQGMCVCVNSRMINNEIILMKM